MTLSIDIVEKIAHEVIRTLYQCTTNCPDNLQSIQNHPFHNSFLQASSTKIDIDRTSIFVNLRQLDDSLWRDFLVRVMLVLSNGETREFNDLKISQSQQTAVSDIATELQNGNQKPNLQWENELIYKNNTLLDQQVDTFTADCYFEDNDKIVAVELKTVKFNSGVFKNEKEKMLSAKAGLKNRFPNKDVFFYLGFPFDPQSNTPTGYDKVAFMNYAIDLKKFIAIDEFLIADELWNFLSGDTNTMKQILDIINDIATTEFMKKFNFINDIQNRTDWSAYCQQLQDWKMFSELDWLNDVKNKLNKSRNLTRALNQSLFTLTTTKDDKTSAKYNSNRFTYR